MRTHKLKTWPQFFDAIKKRRKNFEIRFNDRGFEVGDVLELVEFADWYTGRKLKRTIKYVFYPPNGAIDFGLKDGYVILGF
jgi:hypothetical protein